MLWQRLTRVLYEARNPTSPSMGRPGSGHNQTVCGAFSHGTSQDQSMSGDRDRATNAGAGTNAASGASRTPAAPATRAPSPTIVPPTSSGSRDIATYREFVRTVATEGTGKSRVIANSSAEHAAVILEQLFVMAQHEVLIVTHELFPAVYAQPEVIDAAVAFLKRDLSTKLSVRLETEVEATHPFIAAARAAGGNRVMFDRIPGVVQSNYGYNFAVADGVHYRFEEDRNNHTAIIRFRDPDVGHSLEEAFAWIGNLSRQSDAAAA
jgi:hypothetical protein